MSRVFSESEVAHHRFPVRSDFATARRSVLGLGHDLVKSGEIGGLRIVGSVARGDFTFASDLDLIILLNSGFDRASLVNIQKYLQQISHASKLPISVIYSDGSSDLDCVNRMLFMDEGLNPTRGNIVGKDPVEYMQSRLEDPVRIFKRFLDYKSDRIQNLSLEPDSPQYLDSLEVLMNLQKGMQVKFEGAQRCLRHDPSWPAGDLEQELARIRQEYDDLIASIRDGYWMATVYPAYYKNLGSRLHPLAVQFLVESTNTLPQLLTLSARKVA